jgi:RNA-directed DNA polymerase
LITSLRIRSTKHLALTLGFPDSHLHQVAENANHYYREFYARVKGKERLLVEAKPDLKVVQRRILDRILMRMPVSDFSFGAVRGRSTKDNARVHVKSGFVAKLDIRNFYPSIHSSRVYRFFAKQQECSPDVARILTLLTTRNHSLPLGISTSPMLADQIVKLIDSRIVAACAKVGLKYSRYVDDITVSGDFPLQKFAGLVISVLKDAGFRVKKSKICFYQPGDLQEEREITGVAIFQGSLTAPTDYVKKLETKLTEAMEQSQRQHVVGSFETRQHYRGQIGYVIWLDSRKGFKLLRLYRKVKWRHLEWAMASQPLSE